MLTEYAERNNEPPAEEIQKFSGTAIEGERTLKSIFDMMRKTESVKQVIQKVDIMGIL